MDSFNKQLDTDGYLYKIKITGIVKNEAGAVIEISSGDGGLSGEPTD